MQETAVSIPKERLQLLENYRQVRKQTDFLCDPLEIEDYVVQSMEDVSPVKWNIGHTTWFFEKLLLEQFIDNYKPYSEIFYFINNSYYETLGKRIDRFKRGTLSRPTVNEVIEYRKIIDEKMENLFEELSEKNWGAFSELVILGINHEQQHQELMLTDLKHLFASNPLYPSYNKTVFPGDQKSSVPEKKYLEFEGGMMEMGADSDGFAYDCERPRHKTFVNPFKLSNRLVTCGEFQEFMDDGGYQAAPLWLSDAWALLKEVKWEHPLYWLKIEGKWHIVTLSGLKVLNPAEPLCHVSYYEAAAFARWRDKRMPTESEWEFAALIQSKKAVSGNFMDNNNYHPVPLSADSVGENEIFQMFGDVWEWTSSAFLPYPGYHQQKGALGEYNGKFMNNQKVLRGGSCATPLNHFRTTYRNFFQPEKRWQFSGFRLAGD